MPPTPISTYPSSSARRASLTAASTTSQSSVEVQESRAPGRRGNGNLSGLAGLSDSRPPRPPQGETESLAPRLNINKYLEIRAERSKNLVIGCGTTPERVMMGTMPGTACSLGSDHHNDFTVDVSSDANPNLTLDFSQSKGSDLLEQGKGHFDKVTFEYLNRGPRNRFSEAEVKGWIEGADTMLKDKSGEILFYNGDSRYRAQARSAMEERGYTVTDVKEDPSTTSPNGHVYCKGKKDDSLTSQFWRLFGR